MNHSILKKFGALFVAAALLVSFTTTADKTNFSGTWALNEGKSDLGEFAQFATRKIKVEQKDDAIVISRTAPSFNGGDETNTETVTFDGKTAESTVFGSSKKFSTAKWADDSKTFTITFKLALDFGGQQMEINGTEKWTIEDGKLTLISASTSPQGERTTKSVYDKQ